MGRKFDGKYKKRVPYLGKITTRWCMNCDVPVLRGKVCPECKADLKSLSLTPPGDVRPAFDFDIALLRETCNKLFVQGVGEYLFPEKIVILLNKIGSLDLDYQVIAHGKIVGNLRYDIFNQDFDFIPTLEGGKWIYKYYFDNGLFDLEEAPPKCIEYMPDAEKFVAGGANVLVPGIVKLDQAVREGDPAIVYSTNGIIATGHFTSDHDEIVAMMAANHGRIAKPKDYSEAVPANEITDPASYPETSLNRTIDVNKKFINKNVKASIDFIMHTIAAFNLPIAVAYSGGKDSLATLLLVKKAIGSGEQQRPFSIFFADTGLEFPEVLQNIEDVVEWAGLNDVYYTRSAGDKFWSLAANFGPPARDFRFCCHTLKANQINEMIEQMVADDGNPDDPRLLVFLGQRQYESFNRAEDKRVYTNSYVPMQVIGTPIKEWTAIDEWLFLLREKRKDPTLPINPLYFQGHDRLGCYLCPAQSMANLARVKQTHPALHERWQSFLEEYQAKLGYPQEWVTWGLWRSKHPKGQWKNLSDQLPKPEGTPSREAVSTENIKLFVTKGVSPCIAGGFSVKGRISAPLILPELLPWVRTLDKRIAHDEGSGLLYLYEPDARLMIYADGSLFLQSPDERFDFDRFIVHLLGVAARSIACEHCGVCIDVCPTSALSRDEDGNTQIDPDKCAGIACQKCTHHCPVYHVVKNNVIPAMNDE
ncbi:MAG TPA: phosphoadenosine phosphosulfate reductase family protein [Candidatus Lokiarchaeia archaeon]|nr:phosphoadenosine phosphosulfate reductase family protein [Candidatus Lokiarchaeia archaeon]